MQGVAGGWGGRRAGMAAAAACATLASCTTTHEAEGLRHPPLAAPQDVQYVQVGRRVDGTLRFIACTTDCPQPTTKVPISYEQMLEERQERLAMRDAGPVAAPVVTAAVADAPAGQPRAPENTLAPVNAGDSVRRDPVLGLAAWSVQTADAELGAGDAGATMGQPLNFAAAVRLEPGVSLSPDCVAAEVVVGDRQMPPPLLRTVIEMTSATTARVRVQSQANIDEPVVHVQLGVGCSNRISRSYVVLADPPGTSVAPTPAPQPAAPARQQEPRDAGSD